MITLIRLSRVLLVGLIIVTVGVVDASAQLAESPWPSYQNGMMNTGQSPYSGPEVDSLKWKLTTPGPQLFSSPAIGPGGLIYIGSGNGALWAVHPDGLVQWTYETQAEVISSPAIGRDGTIYFGTSNNQFVAVNPDSTLKWQLDFKAAADSGFADAGPVIGPSGTIYAGTNTDSLYAIEPSGTIKWGLLLNGDLNAPVIGPDTTIYAGNRSGKLYAIDTEGRVEWSVSMGRFFSAPAVGPDGTVYVGSTNDTLYSVSDQGSIKWKFDAGGSIHYSPAISSDHTIYTGGEGIHALNEDGSLKWDNESLIAQGAPLIDSNGTLFLNNMAVDSTGEVKWEAEEVESVSNGMAMGSEGTLYARSEPLLTNGFEDPNYYLYAIGDRTQTNIHSSDDAAPGRFRLKQNYPNPFNPTTAIRFELPAATHVRLAVYDVLGQRVRILLDERLQAGAHRVTFEGSGLASGLYIYRISTPSFSQSRTMQLLK